jgi:predicted anti-sigma-YlaC factor YlaD
MIRCEDALRELWGYLFDEVTPESRALIAEHLDACRRCCGEIAFLGELQRVVASAAPELPPDVGVRMEAFLATLEGGTGDRPDAQG